MSITTLIIEDELTYARFLDRVVSHAGFTSRVARSGEEGLAAFLDTHPPLVLLDLGLPGIGGIDVLRKIKTAASDTVCIVISGKLDVEDTIQAMRSGAFDVIQKTAGFSEVQMRLQKAVEMASLRRQLRLLTRTESPEAIIGDSEALRHVRQQIREVARTPASTVLITGETGTGKELVARAIHRLSDREARPMVTVNCAAIPESLLESEFFGYERGAFTGADNAKAGLFEAADGGSLFLDEIGELDLKLQAKLLRVVEEKTVHPVGGGAPLRVDVRLIVATNRDMEALVRQGRFRQDLFYRLNVFQIDVPPLRERRDDILCLARHFVKVLGEEMGKPLTDISPEAEASLLVHEYPGNVRQLRNLVEQAVIVCKGDRLTARDFRGLPPSAPSLAPGDPPAYPELPADLPATEMHRALRQRQAALTAFERQVVERALTENRGNRSHAAKALGINRYSLLRWMRRLNIDS